MFPTSGGKLYASAPRAVERSDAFDEARWDADTAHRRFFRDNEDGPNYPALARSWALRSGEPSNRCSQGTNRAAPRTPEFHYSRYETLPAAGNSPNELKAARQAGGSESRARPLLLLRCNGSINRKLKRVVSSPPAANRLIARD